VLFDLANDLNRSRAPATAALLRSLAGTLGVLQQAPRAFLQAALGGGGLDEATITAQIAARAAAKAREELCRSRPHPPGAGGPGRGTEGFATGTTWVRA
jgi:cysteinyl-tRNA synthetase